MHTATLGRIEALLIGVATTQPEKTMASLNSLNELRAKLVGRRLDIRNAQVGAQAVCK
jgi:hypothetical protein